MDPDSLMQRVPPEWRAEFRTFVNTGEAREEFLDLLDSDPAMQAIAEEAFEMEASRFEQFASRLKELEPVAAHPERAPELLSSELARTVRMAATLSSQEQHVIAEQTANELRHSASPRQRQQVSSLMSQLNQALAM